MKRFISQVLATIVGILLLFGITIFLLILMGIFSGSDKKSVKDNSVLEITLKKPILESPSQKSTSIFEIESGKTIYFKEVIDLIKYAKTDTKIKGISLKLTDVQSGYADISELRQALQDFKKSGKFVYAYNNDSSQRSYYLASVADSLYLNPSAMIELSGISSEVHFFKNFGDKYGVGFDVIRHGKFKSAVEPFLRDNMSDENRLQLKELTHSLWTKISTDIAASRKLNINQVNTITDSLWGFIPELALKSKLVDKLINESQYDEIIKKKLGLSSSDKKNVTSLANYYDNVDLTSSEKDKIAILYASGEIYSGKGDQGVYSTDFIKLIKKAKEDKDIKAVVLRVNSPGGSANASAEILYELSELKKVKPLVVSFGDVAASGGYYISMAADAIYAQDNTITGSIGVFGMFVNVKNLSKNIGITSDYVATNANSMIYSPTQGLADGARSIIYRSIDMTYKKFVGVVMNNRHKSFEQIDAIGGGRVWSGTQALNIGLVDKIGTLSDAVNDAARRAKITKFSTVSFPEEKDAFQELLKKISGKDDDDDDEESQADVMTDKIIEKKLGKENYKIFKMLQETEKNNGIMYLMPFEVNFN